MPFVRVSLPQQLTDAQIRHVSDSIHHSMVATFNVPQDDRFQVVSRHPPQEIVCAPS